MRYVKAFLINARINQRLWQMPHEAIRRRLGEWIGKPLLWYAPDDSPTHPNYPTREETMREQERYRVGTIVAAGFDERTENYFAISTVKDEKIWKKLKDGKLAVSPSVHPLDGQEVGPVDIITDALPTHLAIVTEGAYGQMATTVGTCEGSAGECATELEPLIASSCSDGSCPDRGKPADPPGGCAFAAAEDSMRNFRRTILSAHAGMLRARLRE